MIPSQQVLLAQLVAFIVFAIGGNDGTVRVQNGIRRLSDPSGATAKPRPAKSDPKLGPEAAVGWAIMFVFLIVLADVPATSDIGVAFAWLILLTVILAYGETAFMNIRALYTPVVTKSPGSVGGLG